MVSYLKKRKEMKMIDIYDTYEPDDVLLDSSWDDIGDIGTLLG